MCITCHSEERSDEESRKLIVLSWILRWRSEWQVCVSVSFRDERSEVEESSGFILSWILHFVQDDDLHLIFFADAQNDKFVSVCHSETNEVKSKNPVVLYYPGSFTSFRMTIHKWISRVRSKWQFYDFKTQKVVRVGSNQAPPIFCCLNSPG